MAFAPKTDWKDGDELTAAAVNRIESGIAEVETTPSPKGDPGKSAYQVAVDAGFEGTESEWLASLKGAKGDAGAPSQEEWDALVARVTDLETPA